ncbi:MAG: putative hydrolase or acyltransferase of alpha/beta superfamily [Acidimicrobiales bacterium]|nr:putative hydrolase or acyltransferase of alpha/beta superfamily [Acidimicrobiales bacterium]
MSARVSRPKLPWARSVGVVLAAAFLAGCTTSPTHSRSSPSTARSKATTTTVRPAPVRTAPIRTRYRVAGRVVSFACHGRGRVPVVLVAGGAAAADVWAPELRLLGPNVLACAFDRPGVGGSERPQGKLTPEVVGAALEGVLSQAGLGQRVIVVGHSIGGTNMAVFGADHPELIAGGVLLDATVPAFAVDAFDRPVMVGLGYDPEATEAQAAAANRWPNVPLEVLVHDPARAVATKDFTEAEQRAWTAGELRYAHLAPHGSMTPVPGASHDIERDNPTAVVTAIGRVLAAAKP